jgi:hypothetical protein
MWHVSQDKPKMENFSQLRYGKEEGKERERENSDLEGKKNKQLT